MRRNLSFRERINFQATNTPRIHNMLMEVGMYVTMVLVILRGSLVVSGGTANGTSLGENPGNLITRLEVDATPGVAGVPAGKLKNFGPRACLRRVIFDKGFFENDLSLGSSGISGAAGTFVLNQAYPLWFALPRAVRPFDTALQLSNYNDVRITLTTGSRDTQFSGNDRTFDFSSVVLDIFDEREAPSQTEKHAVLFEEDRPVNIVAANTEFPVREQLPADGNYESILWIAETTNQTLSDSIINEVDLFAGSEMFAKLPKDHIKQLQRFLVTDQAQSMTGLYLTPVVRGGRLNSSLPGVYARLDVSNPGTDRLIVATRRLKA